MQKKQISTKGSQFRTFSSGWSALRSLISLIVLRTDVQMDNRYKKINKQIKYTTQTSFVGTNIKSELFSFIQFFFIVLVRNDHQY